MASEIPQVHVRLKALPLIDEWAEKHGLSRSDAINMMCMTYLEIEKEVIQYVRDRRIRNRSEKRKPEKSL